MDDVGAVRMSGPQLGQFCPSFPMKWVAFFFHRCYNLLLRYLLGNKNLWLIALCSWNRTGDENALRLLCYFPRHAKKKMLC